MTRAPSVIVALALCGACNGERTSTSAARTAPSAAAPATSAVTTAPASAATADSTLPPITAAELRKLAAKQGAKGVMVNVWASWCGSCKHELPMLSNLAPEYRRQGVLLVSVTVDEPASLAAAKQLTVDLKLAFPAYRLGEPIADFKAAMHPRWPGMLPASFLYDATGALRYFWGGEAYENEVMPILDGFVAGRPIDGTANFGLAPGKVE